MLALLQQQAPGVLSAVQQHPDSQLTSVWSSSLELLAAAAHSEQRSKTAASTA